MRKRSTSDRAANGNPAVPAENRDARKPVRSEQLPRVRRRKPQARSADTQERILSAALQCLVERGYARTATADVAERAGMSRGAQLHHFPTRADLLAATVEHLTERRLAEFRGTIARLPPNNDEIGAAIDFLWSAFSDDSAYATLELIVAARTDEELHASLRPVADRFAETLNLADRELAPHPEDRERFNSFRNLVLVSLQGLAVMQIIKHNDALIRGVLDLLKELYRDLFPPSAKR